MNILEVPIQAKPLPSKSLNASTSSFGSAVFTMDPQDKYLSPKPSVHRSVASRLSRLSKSSLANLSARFARLVTRQSPDHSKVSCRTAKERCKSSSYLPRRWPPHTSFQKQRATKSAGDDLSNGSPHFFIATTRKLSDSALDILSHARGSVTATLAKTATNVHHASGFTEFEPDSPGLHSADPQAPPNTAQNSIHPAKRSAPPPVGNDCLARFTRGKPVLQSSSDDETPHEWYDATDRNNASTSSSSHFSNDMCSLSFGPSTDPTGSTSPRRSSKSGSPMSGDQRRNISWIDDRPDASIAYTVYQPTETSQLGLRVPSPHFSGSSLPEADHDSMLTIKQHPSSHFEPPGFRSPLHQNDSQVRVQAWNDGTKHPTTTLEELIDDLGYLGKLII